MPRIRVETIKSVHTKRYDIALVQTPSGLYYIKCEKKGDEETVVSESMTDLGIALHVFDVKIEELEGN